MHFASTYRWHVATRCWTMPAAFSGKVLDVGADEGGFGHRLAADFIVNMDIRRAAASSLPFVQADAVALPFPSAEFQHVLAFDVLEHVVCDSALLEEAVRVLRPGGTLWLSSTARGFFLYPGGFLQKRLEEAWGHVRRGYGLAELQAKFPPHVKIEISTWNEPCFRFFYVGLWLCSKVSPRLAGHLVQLAVAIDAKHPLGESGHLYVKVLKG